jgi:transcriptional regulator GlxA family with amidase domain
MRIAVIAFPGVQRLDVVGPIDVFNEASRQAGDPHAYTFEIISPVPGPIRASNGMRFEADATLATASCDIDTLLVAGSPHITELEHDEALRAWLIKRAPRVRRIGSVCSGAFFLANAGLLEGRRVTTHWNSSQRLAASYPSVHVECDQIYVKDGPIYTSAGVTAGMDLALALVEEDLGHAVAMSVARELVMFLKRPGGQSQFSAHLAAQSSARDVIRDVQDWVLENLDKSLHVDVLAVRAGMSTRNFARLFKQDTATTPADFVEAARIDAARRLLEDSASPLKRVASRCGFGDPNSLRRTFVRRLGVTPTDYRNRFQQLPGGLG